MLQQREDARVPSKIGIVWAQLSVLERELHPEPRGLGGPDLTIPKEPAYHRNPEGHLVSLSSWGEKRNSDKRGMRPGEMASVATGLSCGSQRAWVQICTIHVLKTNLRMVVPFCNPSTIRRWRRRVAGASCWSSTRFSERTHLTGIRQRGTKQTPDVLLWPLHATCTHICV